MAKSKLSKLWKKADKEMLYNFCDDCLYNKGICELGFDDSRHHNLKDIVYCSKKKNGKIETEKSS